MNKKILNEEIDRLKLLSIYQTKLTLSENEEIKEYSIGPQNKLARELQVLTNREVEDKLRSSLGKYTGSLEISGVKHNRHGSDDIIYALKRGTLKPAEVDNLFVHFIKDMKDDASAEAKKVKEMIIDDFVTKPKFSNKYAQMTEEQAVQTLLGTGNWSREDAEMVIQKYKDRGGRFKPGGDIKPVPPVPVPPIPVPPVPTPKPTWWERMWGNKTFKYALAAAAGAGIYQLLSWWMGGGKDSKEVQWVPGCLKIVNNGNFTIQDLEKLSKSRTVDSFPMSSPVVKDMGSKRETTMSDVEIKKDGTFTSSKGNGEWQAQGDKVIFNQGGNVFYIDCSDKTEVVPPVPVPPVPVPDPSGCGSFTPCSKFPFRKCCEAKEIQDVQKCLGISADGKFGNQTERALGKSYLTRSEYDGIMRDCEGNTTKQTTIAPERNIYGSEEP
jgi:hypothetical protein